MLLRHGFVACAKRHISQGKNTLTGANAYFGWADPTPPPMKMFHQSYFEVMK